MDVYILKHNLSRISGQKNLVVTRVFNTFEAANRAFDEIWTNIMEEDEFAAVYPGKLTVDKNGEFVLNETMLARYEDCGMSIGAGLAGRY